MGPVSGAAEPALLMSEVTPSCCNRVTVVPAGKLLTWIVMSNVSVPLPLFQM